MHLYVVGEPVEAKKVKYTGGLFKHSFSKNELLKKLHAQNEIVVFTNREHALIYALSCEEKKATQTNFVRPIYLFDDETPDEKKYPTHIEKFDLSSEVILQNVPGNLLKELAGVEFFKSTLPDLVFGDEKQNKCCSFF